MVLQIVLPTEIEARFKSIAKTKLYGDTPEKVAEKLITLALNTNLEGIFSQNQVAGFVHEGTKDLLQHCIQCRITTREDPWELVVYKQPIGYCATHIIIPLVDGVHIREANDEYVHLTFYPEKLWNHVVQ